MKTKLALLLIPVFILLGCGDLNKISISDYYILSATSAASSYTTKYAVTSVDPGVATGYSIATTLPSPSFTLSVLPKDETTSVEVTPVVTFNGLKVVYTIVGDTQGLLMGTWNPTTINTGTNIVIPSSKGGATRPSVTVIIDQIASTALASEIFGKIGVVTPILDVSGTYSFILSLRTSLTVRADVTLTGSDNHWKNDVTHAFSTTLYFSQ